MADDYNEEVVRYSARTEYGALYIPLHLFLIFTPFFIGLVVAGNTTWPYSSVAMFGGIGLTWLLCGPLFSRSLEWVAFIAMLLAPRQPEADS